MMLMRRKKKLFKRYYGVDVTGYLKKGYKKGLGRSIMKKFAVTSVGKSVLKNFISPDGYMLIDTVKSVVTELSGEEEGKLWETHIMTFATDVAYLVQDKVLEKQALLNCRGPIYKFWSDALDMLELSFAYDKDKFSEDIIELQTAVHALLDNHLVADKFEHYDTYAKFFSKKKNIHKFYKSEQFVEQREILRSVLRKIWVETFFNGLE